eukprot:436289-Amphidinium_carterae.1
MFSLRIECNLFARQLPNTSHESGPLGQAGVLPSLTKLMLATSKSALDALPQNTHTNLIQNF